MNAVTELKQARPDPVFSRVLVGVDGSEESLEAARQAAALVDGELTLLAAYDVAPAIVGAIGYNVPSYLDEDRQREAATAALARAGENTGPAAPPGKVVRGRAADALFAEIERRQETLLVVGSHGLGRLAGFVMGSTATEAIGKAPCSVLVARRRSESDGFPNRIVVGVDGSPESAAAYATARRLADRFGVELSPVVAHGGKSVDPLRVGLVVDRPREDVPDEPVAALVDAAADADLLVVGSRGLGGLRALGSVSERVAHQARTSVLIVREPGSTGGDDELREAS